MVLQNYTVPTNSKTNTTRPSQPNNQPPPSPTIAYNCRAAPVGTSEMDDDHVIKDELRRRRGNNARLRRQEEERHLIAEREGKIGNFVDEDGLISYLQDQGRQRREP